MGFWINKIRQKRYSPKGEDRFQRKWFLEILLSCQKELNVGFRVIGSLSLGAILDAKAVDGQYAVIHLQR